MINNIIYSGAEWERHMNIYRVCFDSSINIIPVSFAHYFMYLYSQEIGFSSPPADTYKQSHNFLCAQRIATNLWLYVDEQATTEI